MVLVSRREWLRLTAAGVAAGLAGATRGAPAPAPEQTMIEIPGGPFLMGTTEARAAELCERYGYHVSWLSGEVPQRTVELPTYRIDKYPVTVREYAAFCEATGHRRPPVLARGNPPAGLLDHPITAVNLADARAYAEWAGKRLPTEAEWEKAARGPEGLEYPWGGEFDPAACHWNRDDGVARGPGTAPVDAHPRGASRYGVLDLSGNVAEWCNDGPGPGSAYLKGGCWLTTQVINLRPAARNMSGFANNPLGFYGFRCVAEAE